MADEMGIGEDQAQDDPLGEALGDESELDDGDPFGSELENMLGGDDGGKGEVRPFDFNRPHNMSRRFEQNLQNIFENMAKIGTIYFTNMFRANVVLEYEKLSLIGCGEFIGNLSTPTCLATVSLPPLKGHALFYMEMDLCFGMLKKLMGGDPDTEDKVRDFTEIERSIFSGMIIRIINQFVIASSRLVKMEPELGEIENNPNYLQGVNIGDTLVQGTFQFKLDTVEGLVSINIPMSSFEPVRELFDPDEERELRSSSEVRKDRRQIMDMLQSSDSNLVVKLAEFEAGLDEVVAWKEGDLIELHQPVRKPLLVEMAGKKLFLGQPGHVQQNRAVKLTERFSEE